MERSGIEGYDERQKSLRYKFGYQAFYVLAVLILVNAYICEFMYEWADTMVAAVIAVMLSIFYFGYRTIFAGAYTGDKVSERRTAILIPVCMVGILASSLYVLPHIIDGRAPLIEDGKATVSFLSVFNTASFVPFTIAYYAKRTRDQRRSDDKE